MLRHIGINLQIKADTKEVLTRLRANLEQHTKLVSEARAGYVKAARAVLEERLGKIVEGKIVNLTFSLTVPKDYSSIYRTAIGQLEAHTEPLINLSSDEYRNLWEDQWGWAEDFVKTNSGYSGSTRVYAASKGIDLE